MPYLNLPDGSSMEVPEGVSLQDALRNAVQKYPEAYGMKPPPAPAKSGIMAALGSGFQSGLGEAASGIGSAVGLEGLSTWGQSQQAKAQAGYKPTSDADIAAAEKANPGILGGLGTRFTQAAEPYAQGMGNIAGRYGVPTLAAIPVGMAAEAAAPVLGLGAAGAELAGASTLGGRALSALGANTVKGAASAAGFGAVNTATYVGSELEQQKSRGEAQDYSSALAYGLAHGAIDQVVGGVLHAPMQGLLGKTAAEQATKLVPDILSGKITTEAAQASISGTLRNIAQGTAQNAVVGTGMMVGHEALNRAAAGQDLTSPEALQAYGENVKGALAFAPIFGAMHGLGARGAAAKELGAAGAERMGTEATAKETAATQPDALRQVYSDYVAAKTDMQGLQQAVDASRPAKGAVIPAEQTQAFTEAQDAAKDHRDNILKPAVAAYEKRRALIDPLITQDKLVEAQQQALQAPTHPIGTENQQALQGIESAGPASVLPTAPQAPNTIDNASNMEAQRQQIQQHLANLQQQISVTNDPAQIKALSTQHASATQVLQAMPENPIVAQNQAIADANTKVAQAQKALDKAKAAKQYDKLPELAQNVLDLKEQVPKAPEVAPEDTQQRGFDFSETKEAAPETPTAPIATEGQTTIPGMESEQPGPTLRGAEQPTAVPEDTEKLRANLTQQVDELESRLYENENTTPAESLRLIPMLESAQKALASLPAPESTQAEQQQIRTNEITAARQKLGTAQKAWGKAKDLGDKDGMRRAATKIAQLEAEMPTPIEFPAAPVAEKSPQLSISETADKNYRARQVRREAAARIAEEMAEAKRVEEFPSSKQTDLFTGEKVSAEQKAEEATNKVGMPTSVPERLAHMQNKMFLNIEELAAKDTTPTRKAELTLENKQIRDESTSLMHEHNVGPDPIQKTLFSLENLIRTAEDNGNDVEVERLEKIVSALKEKKEARNTSNLKKTVHMASERITNSEDPEDNRRMVDSAVERLKMSLTEPRREGEKSVLSQANVLYEDIKKLEEQKKDASLTAKEQSNLEKSLKTKTAAYNALIKNKVSPVREKIEQLESGKVSIKDSNETKAEKALRVAKESSAGKNAFESFDAQKAALEAVRGSKEKNSAAQKKIKAPVEPEVTVEAAPVGKATSALAFPKSIPGNTSAGVAAPYFKKEVLLPARKAVENGLATRVKLKDGSTVSLVRMHDTYSDTPSEGRILALDRSGKIVGDLGYGIGEGQHPDVFVAPEARRLGVASAMYDLAEKTGNTFPVENAVRTPDGMAFRKARNAENVSLPPADETTPKYRTGPSAPTGKTQTEVAAFTDRVTANWKNKPPIEVVQSLADLPEKLRLQAAKDTVNPKGVFDPESGKVFIIADNAIDSHDVAATIAHETLGHFGLRSILGDTYGKVMDDMFMGNAAIRKVANEHIDRGTDRRTATEEALAEMAESGAEPTLLQKVVNFVRKAAQKIGLTFDGVTDGEVTALIANARAHVMSGDTAAEGRAGVSGAPLYRTKSNPKLANAMALANDTVGKKEQSVKERLSGNLDLKMLTAETHFVDQFAPARVALSKMKDSYKAMQTQYYLSMSRQVNNLLGSVLKTGALQRVEETDAKGITRYAYEAKAGANLVDVNKSLTKANTLTGSSDATNKLFSLYTIAKRSESVGLDRMNYGENITQERMDQAMKEIAAVPGLKEIFDNAQKQYHEFNKDMVDFAVQSGSLSKEIATKMLANKDYVPYYRENKDGSVSLLMGNEEITKVGNVKTQPYLHELVGGDQRIMDFNGAAVQNAQMLLNMGLRNTALKNLAYNLQELQMADPKNENKQTSVGVIRPGMAEKSDNKFNFKQDGKDFHVIVSDTPEVPAALMIKGLEGIPVQTSTILKIAGMPSNLLRQIIVANPVTAARILFKDTISSAMTSGSNLDVMGKAFQNAKSGLLERRGIVGGELFQGLPEDMAHILREVQSGKPGWESLLSKAHVLHAKADAITRQARYESYLKQGMSEVEATHQALESMNFTRRGISPSIHILNTLNPFINSQIQGLNILVKSLRGNMSYNEKLDIQRKVFQRGMMVAASSMVYAAIMQDDDAYKNATPEQKYNNWFMPIPGSNEKFRVPIPFEAGILFKSVPEALVNAMYGEGKDAAEGMKQAMQKLIPGGDTLGIPQILRPAIEAKLGTSFYTGRSIESPKEQQLPAGQRSRPTTTAFADEIGNALNISPIMLDHVLQGYTGSMGTAVMSIASSLVFDKQQPEGTAAKHGSQMPIISSVFQPEDAGNIVNQAYGRMQEIKEVKNQYNNLKESGRVQEANAYAEKMSTELAMAGNASQFDAGMKQYARQMQAIKNMPTGTADQQMERLDALKKLRTNFAAESLARVAGKT